MALVRNEQDTVLSYRNSPVVEHFVVQGAQGKAVILFVRSAILEPTDMSGFKPD